MQCPGDKRPIVAQFDDKPDTFWKDFAAANPGKNELALRMHFDVKYGKCFASSAGSHSTETSFKLASEKKAALRTCLLKP